MRSFLVLVFLCSILPSYGKKSDYGKKKGGKKPRIVGGTKPQPSKVTKPQPSEVTEPQSSEVTRIVGGAQAHPDKFPYFVEWSSAGCGGTLIHEDVVLTAAHCYNPLSADSRVWVGSDWTSDGTERNIMNITTHPNYSPDTYEYDFMVLKLDQPVDARTVTLNGDASKPLNGESLTVAGFGDLFDGSGQGSWTLQEVNVNQVPHTTCNQQYSGFIQPDFMFCAGNPGKDSCQGDSGGPIIDMNGVQLGVVSFGSSCGSTEFSGVYARVSAAVDWIDEQICHNARRPPPGCGGGYTAAAPVPPSNHDDNHIATEYVIRVNIFYDGKPRDISWGISRANFAPVEWSDFDQVSEADSLVSTTIRLGPGIYWFFVFDRGFDGLCCNNGEGWIEVSDMTHRRLIWESDGNFGGGTQEMLRIGI